VFLNHFDVLMSKIIFKKNIINIYFKIKTYLKNNHNHIINYIFLVLLRGTHQETKVSSNCWGARVNSLFGTRQLTKVLDSINLSFFQQKYSFHIF